MKNQMSPMELLSLLHKSNNADVDLSLAERALLSVILCYVNGELKNGYEAWPSTDIIVAKTGLSTTGITNCRKALVAKGWVQIVSGRKAGVANHYWVDAKKIVATAAKSGIKGSGKEIAEAVLPGAVKEQHVRDTGGLKQGTVVPAKPAEQKPVEVSKPVEPKIVITKPADTTLDWLGEPKQIVVKKPDAVPPNKDGSNPFHPNGERCYSYEDHKNAPQKAEERRIAEVNSGDVPF